MTNINHMVWGMESKAAGVEGSITNPMVSRTYTKEPKTVAVMMMANAGTIRAGPLFVSALLRMTASLKKRSSLRSRRLLRLLKRRNTAARVLSVSSTWAWKGGVSFKAANREKEREGEAEKRAKEKGRKRETKGYRERQFSTANIDDCGKDREEVHHHEEVYELRRGAADADESEADDEL